MNLWDKEADYCDPSDKVALVHDDQCPTCMRERNGLVGRNSVRRPDGIVTFGSPFVTFQKRSGGLLTAQIAVWLYRMLALVPLTALIYYLWSDETIRDAVTGQAREERSFVRTALILATPLLVYWLLAQWISALQSRAAQWWDKGSNAFIGATTTLLISRYVLLGLLGFY
jgi:hypothetical protein